MAAPSVPERLQVQTTSGRVCTSVPTTLHLNAGTAARLAALSKALRPACARPDRGHPRALRR